MSVSAGASFRESVSVVVTAYSRPDYLAQALRSLELQRRLPDEVIVVDDGSPDPLSPSSTLPMKLLRQDNRGPAAARNHGAAHSSGSVLFFLDDDDLFSPNRISNALVAHETSDIVCCAQTSFVDDPSVGVDARLSTPFSTAVAPRRSSAVRLLERSTPGPGATSLRRGSFVDFDESYRASQDVEWWIRYAKCGEAVTRIDLPDLMVRRHPGVRHTNGRHARILAGMRLLVEHADYFRRHPKARSFRLARLSIMSGQDGMRADAVRFAVYSILVHPSRPGFRALAAVTAG